MTAVYGVIAEDPSDIETLRVLIRRLSNNSGLPLKGKGYSGCGEMLNKGASQLKLFARLGCKRFIICYDADGPDAMARRQAVVEKIIIPSGLPQTSCLALVPVQEIEAWILADIHQAVPHVIPSWKPDEVSNPEGIASPKEHLEHLSRGSNKKPRYVYTIHNSQVARYLAFATVHRKCKSFRPLQQFIVGHRRIKLPADPFPGMSTRGFWAYTDAGGVSQFLPQQLATAAVWGEVITYDQGLDDQPTELTRLAEYGWGGLGALEGELQDLLGAQKLKGRLRATLTVLQGIAANRQDARFLGLDDGTR
jgi:hypothetical protein